MKSDVVIVGAAIAAAAVLLSKGKVGGYVGESATTAAGSFLSGGVKGGIKSILVEPYEWAQNYEGYIPIIDDVAKRFANFKTMGNPDKWFS